MTLDEWNAQQKVIMQQYRDDLKALTDTFMADKAQLLSDRMAATKALGPYPGARPDVLPPGATYNP